MYGKKRILIEKTGVIVLAGNKSYIPIGKTFLIDGLLVGKLLKPENEFETLLDEHNSFLFNFKKSNELRTFVKNIYKEQLI